MIGSLCSGIGGLELGLAWATNQRVAWQAEVDPDASSVLARHWPGVPNLGDMAAVQWADDGLDYGDGISRSLEVDVICAGYPCQPFSHAGLRAGEADARNLWPLVLRAVRVLRPRRVLLENVSGHLSLGFGRVLGDLAEAGYDAQWCCLRSADVGAPHRRERIFIAATDTDQPRSQGPESAQRPIVSAGRAAADPDGRRWGQRDPRIRCLPIADSHASPDTDGAGCEQLKRPESGMGIRYDTDRRGGFGAYQAAVDRWADVMGSAPAPTDQRGRLSAAFVGWMMGFPPGWVDGLKRTSALRCLGNACQPQVAALAAAILLPELAEAVA